MQQMDRLNPLIDKKHASLSKNFFFIQINSSYFLLLSLIISQMCKKFPRKYSFIFQKRGCHTFEQDGHS